VKTQRVSETTLREAKELFASGWTVTDIAKKLGIRRQTAESVAHEYLLEQAESSN